jgi:DNA invertase Pin-like site-specific DNA recombinase
MHTPEQLAGDEDPDIVIAMIREVLDLGLGLTTEQAANIERRLKERYGDRRIRVKKKLLLSPEEVRVRVFEDAMTTMSTHDIAKRHGITARTVYRWMKKGNPTAPR